jgi:diguanylate cyclase (GGDEF)-like protein
MTEPGGPIERGDPSWLLLREDVGETYEAVARSAAAAVGAEVCRLALYDGETDELIAQRPRYTAAGQSVPTYRVRPSPASSRVLRSGEPYLSNDPASDPLYEPSVREHGVHSVLTVPVRYGPRILGLLYALNKPGGFLPRDARTLQALAGAAAVTLENVRLYAEERQRRIFNEGLRELSRALVSTPASEDAALGTVLDQIWRVLRYEVGLAVVLESGRLRVAACRGADAGMELPLRAAPEVAAALEQPEPHVIDAAALLPALGVAGVAGTALAAPLRAQGHSFGAFILVFEPDIVPSAPDRQLVAALADHAALFLEAAVFLRRERVARVRAAAASGIARHAATHHDPEALLQAVAPELLTVGNADRVVLYETHSRSPVLVPKAEAGATAEEQASLWSLRLDLAAGPLASLAHDRQPMRLEGRECRELSPFRDATSLLVVPICSRDALLGAIVLAAVGHEGNFDSALAEYLVDLANQVALGVENARLFARLSQMASTDELTQLANRRRFAETLRSEIDRARRSDAPVSLVLLDIDHLKVINDSHGHPAGDAAIRHVAVAIRSERREADLAARLGGEEFALLLPATPLVGAVTTAERIRGFLSNNAVPGVSVVTVSAGVATFPDDAEDEENLVRVADERLYAAKSAGRNLVCAAGAQKPLSWS